METEEPRTLLIRNLPTDVTNEKLSDTFSEFGPIRTCFVVADRETQISRGFGYVKFCMREDGDAAREKGVKIGDQKLIVLEAKTQPVENKKKIVRVKRDPDAVFEDTELPGQDKQRTETVKETKEIKIEDDGNETEKPKPKKKTRKLEEPTTRQPKANKDKTKPKGTATEAKDHKKTKGTLTEAKDKTKPKATSTEAKDPKIPKGVLTETKDVTKPEGTSTEADGGKKCRLIIRNLSFKITEEKLKAVFLKYGELSEVHIPKKPDGKMRGFGFVQFTTLQNADKAVKAMNSAKILDRQVAVDWALSKSRFEEMSQKKPVETKKEPDDSVSSDEDADAASEESDESEMEEDDDVSDTSAEDNDHSDDDMDEEDDDSDDDDDDDSDLDSDEDSVTSEQMKPKRPVKSDVDQGRTVFIRNLSYDTEDEGLEEFFEKFGEVNYARVVINPQTEHSKGTAFVQFKKKEVAEKVLAAAENPDEPMMLDGRRLSLAVALSRESASKITQDKNKKEEKDSRNLYLVREGMIRQGTEAAEGLSTIDLNKRQKLESTKRQKLKDPNIFVSSTRLSVHNIPVSCDDARLRQVFRKAADDRNAYITECRIMRDLQRVNSKGESKSRGFAFVNFSEHRHALRALRQTNNNPEIFGDKRRLIVEFSLENRAALQAKEKRLERSKAKLDSIKKGKNTFVDVRLKKKPKDKQRTAAYQHDDMATDTVRKGPKGMPSHSGAKDRHRNRGQQAPKRKVAPKPAQRFDKKPSRQERKRKSGVKANPKAAKRSRREEHDNVDMLVNKYRSKISAAYKKGKATSAKGGGSKWFV